MDVEERRMRAHRGFRAERLAGDEARPQPSGLVDGQAVGAVVIEGGLGLLGFPRQPDPRLDAVRRPPSRRARSKRSECVIPRPAVIQLTSPGRIACSEPRLSRCMISPSKR